MLTGSLESEFMYKRGSVYAHVASDSACIRVSELARDTHTLGVAAMQRGGCLDVQEHTRNARSRSLV
jgi:hypothetical protein